MLSKNYKPTQKEKFMNAKMKEYFRLKLASWKKDLLKESSLTLNNLQKEENSSKPDLTDRAAEEIERSIELRTRDRERKLINKIDAALKRIDDMEFYPDECVKTNIIGSENVAIASQNNDIKKCILISTDKACQPINVYGSSKFIAERIFTNYDYNSTFTIFFSLR